MRLLVLAALLAAACSLPTTTLAGQGPDRPLLPAASADTVVASRAKPLNYFFRSLLLPGWGQASLDRKLTGGLFMAFEGLALGMALKAHAELGYLERVESERIDDKRRERQDWFVLMGVNHLFSGLEAFVSANLFDFPGDLTARALPGGRTGYGLAVPMPR
jgi:hypothetical protein